MSETRTIGHLERRRIEGRVLVPFIAVCREKFGDAATRDLVMSFIRAVSVDDGRKSAERFGGDLAGLRRIAEEVWGGPGGGIELQMIEQTDERLAFNVTRCRYAEMYKGWGLAELGSLLQCSRDFPMLEGFDDGIELRRTQTIMQGAACCDFRYRRKGDA
jgi:hypothetical protein